MLAAGTVLGRYEILGPLGAGGMGEVYRAHDPRLDRPVAIKILPERSAADPASLARFEREARALAALSHPNIVAVFDFGVHADVPYVVSELLTGETLRDRVLRSALPWKKAVELAQDIAVGLAAAHVRGIVHRDLKPENIFLTEDGQVKVLDFGLARMTSVWQLTKSSLTPTQTHATSPGSILGTSGYMSPEQARGQEADARSDVFAFGCVLYEMVTGRRAFARDTATETLAAILRDAPPELAALGISVPAELERVIGHCLEKDSAQRFQSSRDLAFHLEALLRSTTPTPEEPIGESERSLQPVRTVSGSGAKRAVAVLPFKLLTPNPEDEYLRVALADSLIHELSTDVRLLVRPITSVERYAKTHVDPLTAGRELNVHVVVTGSIQRAGPRVRVQVQACNIADGAPFSSAKHDAEITDLFALQDAMATELARALGARVPSGPPEPQTPPTTNARAYEMYLRAVERLARLNRWDMRSAIELLEDATTLAPKFADAWARLAEAALQMAATYEPEPRWFKRAEQAIRRALVIDPDSASAKCARGQLLFTPAKRFQNRAALQALGQALRANPGHYQVRLWQSFVQIHVGLLDEGRQGLLASLDVNPDDSRTLTFLGQALGWAGDYAGQEEYNSRAVRLDPASMWPNIFLPTAAAYQGNPDRAAELLEAARKVLPTEPTLTSIEAMVWAHRGDKRKTEQAIRRALKGGKPVLHTHHMLHNIATAYGTIGRSKQAIAMLREAARTGFPCYPGFRDDPHFHGLRTYAPFVQLMDELRKEWNGYRREFGAQASS